MRGATGAPRRARWRREILVAAATLFTVAGCAGGDTFDPDDCYDMAIDDGHSPEAAEGICFDRGDPPDPRGP